MQTTPSREHGRIDALERALREDGYVPGRPSGRIASEDELMCALHACPRCRTVGLAYRPFVREIGSGYRILAACTACAWAQEF